VLGYVLARVVFAVAAAATFAASMGVVVPAHKDAPGTSALHDHPLGAYSFAFVVDPPFVTGSASPAMVALHRAFALAGIPLSAMADMPGMGADVLRTVGPIVAPGSLSPLLLGVEFALLVLLAVRLARPDRRPIAYLSAPSIGRALWQLPLDPAPPRSPVRRAAFA